MSEFAERPTLREWKANLRRQRWEKRLARAPGYTLGLLLLLVIACGVLIWGVTR